MTCFVQWDGRKINPEKKKSFCSLQPLDWEQMLWQKERKDEGKTTKGIHRGKKKEMAAWSEGNWKRARLVSEDSPAAASSVTVRCQRAPNFLFQAPHSEPCASPELSATIAFLCAYTVWRFSFSSNRHIACLLTSRCDLRLNLSLCFSQLWLSLCKKSPMPCSAPTVYHNIPHLHRPMELAGSS